MFKITLIATLAVSAFGSATLNFKDSAGACSLVKNGDKLNTNCADLSIGGTDVIGKLNELEAKIDAVADNHLVAKVDVTASNTRCDECFARDISVADGGHWGSVFVEIEAWGGHQGGGTHGCYYHSKLSLNAYQDVNEVIPSEYKSWGDCGEFLVTRPDQVDNMDENLVGCDASFGGTNTNCEAGTRSVHGWHGNILRVKKTAGTAVYQGPYFIKVTVGGSHSQVFAIKDSSSKACPILSSLESAQSASRT